MANIAKKCKTDLNATGLTIFCMYEITRNTGKTV